MPRPPRATGSRPRASATVQAVDADLEYIGASSNSSSRMVVSRVCKMRPDLLGAGSLDAATKRLVESPTRAAGEAYRSAVSIEAAVIVAPSSRIVALPVRDAVRLRGIGRRRSGSGSSS